MTVSKKLFFLLLLPFLIYAPGVNAQDVWDQLAVDVKIENLFNIFVGIGCWVSRIAIPIMIIVILFYGWETISSKEPEALANAKKKMIWAFVGILVIFGTYMLIATVARAVGIQDIGFVNLLRGKCTGFTEQQI